VRIFLQVHHSALYSAGHHENVCSRAPGYEKDSGARQSREKVQKCGQKTGEVGHTNVRKAHRRQAGKLAGGFSHLAWSKNF
jgi:hypothetical protein